MKIWRYPGNWADVLSAVTDSARSGEFVGVAIGQGSEEGLVLVNGERLASGRVLPLAASRYNVTRADEFTDGAQVPPSVKVLEIYLFEHCGELAVDVRRAPRAYQDAGAGNGLAGPLADADVLTIPFQNRRHAQIEFFPSGPLTRYRITGRTRDGASIELADVAGAFTDPFAVHVGGTDHEEMFTELIVSVTVGAGDSIDINAMVVGDL